jgi:hypothetical protein
VEAACHDGRAMGSAKYMEVRLEELDWKRAEAILAFCAIEPHPGIRRFFDEEIASWERGRWRERCEPGEEDTMRRWIGPTMQWLGYPW